MTGRNYCSRRDEFTFIDSEYADDTAVLFGDRKGAEERVPHIMKHFEKLGMEVHRGDKKSKSKLLFLHMYVHRDTFGNTDLSDIDLGNKCYIFVVEKF